MSDLNPGPTQVERRDVLGLDANVNEVGLAQQRTRSGKCRRFSQFVGPLRGDAALMMATVCGARAQGRSAECGVIELGMDADLILLDFNQPHLIPCHNVLSQLVYAASGHDVALTMVRGKILYADGKYPTLDIAGALKELHDYAIPRVFSDGPEAQA